MNNIDLFEKLKNEHGDIWKEFHNYSEKELNKEVNDFRKQIKEYNQVITDPMEKIMLTNPYYYDKIVDGLHHYACEISGDKYKDSIGVMALFSGWDKSVL